MLGKTDATLKHFARRYDLSGRKNIDFHLSPGFPGAYKPIVREVIAAWNVAFKAAVGRDNVIVLHEDTTIDEADPRVSMIVFVEDRNDAGLLGYGPSFFDPATGEILSSKTYLHADGIKYVVNMASDYYDLATGARTIDDFAGDAAIEAVESSAKSRSGAGFANVTIRNRSNFGTETMTKRARKAAVGLTTPTSPLAANPFEQGSKVTLTIPAADRSSVAAKAKLASVLDPLGALKRVADARALTSNGKVQELFGVLSEGKMRSISGRFQGCQMETESTLASAIKFIGAHAGKSKSELLGEIERRVVFTTLLHEVGHNLGLRHNFKGSFDESNYPSEYFQLKLKKSAESDGESNTSVGEWPEKYRGSSVMDYNDDFEALYKAAGPYDVAAIKFGYGNKLEKVVGQDESGALLTEDISTSQFDAAKEKLAAESPSLSANVLDQKARNLLHVRPYLFCTDEHVEDDPTCNRFDSGTTVAEITENLIQDYETSYALGAFRRGRREFTGNSRRVMSRFVLPLRRLLDEYVYNIVNETFVAKDKEDGSANPGSPRDYLDAINASLSFFMQTLSTPEPGVYHVDASKDVLVKGRVTEEGAKNVVVPLGIGKYLLPRYELVGTEERVLSRGVEDDKIAILFALGMRGYPAEKYLRAQLAVNYFDLIRQPMLRVYSEIMRDDYKIDVSAVKGEDGDYHVIRDGGEGEKMSFKIEPGTSLAVQEYAAIFGMLGLDSGAQKLFGNYIDVRLEGVNAAFPSGVETASFKSADGLKTYVAADTEDGLSISFKVVKKAAEAAEKKARLKALISNPPDRQAEQTQVISLLSDAWLLAEGKAIPERVVELLKKELDQHLDEIDSLFGEWLEKTEDQALREKLAEIRIKITLPMTTLRADAKAASEAKSNLDQLSSELEGAESKLRRFQGLYSILN